MVCNTNDDMDLLLAMNRVLDELYRDHASGDNVVELTSDEKEGLTADEQAMWRALKTDYTKENVHYEYGSKIRALIKLCTDVDSTSIS